MPDPNKKEVREMPDWMKDMVKKMPIQRHFLESDADYRKRQIEHDAAEAANESIDRLIDA